jgi:hypothetical protein
VPLWQVAGAVRATRCGVPPRYSTADAVRVGEYLCLRQRTGRVVVIGTFDSVSIILLGFLLLRTQPISFFALIGAVDGLSRGPLIFKTSGFPSHRPSTAARARSDVIKTRRFKGEVPVP